MGATEKRLFNVGLSNVRFCNVKASGIISKYAHKKALYFTQKPN
jgi:hypothetical protein|tara:strand:+ start:227 stop:358 length:132 start_codon:yes stop_codon:yes gene_type:complete